MTESHLKELARSTEAAVFAAPDEARWTIGNGLIEKSLVYSEEDGLRTDGISCGVQLAWIGRSGREFGLRWNGVAIAPGDQGLLGVDAESDDSSVTLIIRLQIADALKVSVHLHCWSGLAMIEQWMVLEALQGGVA